MKRNKSEDHEPKSGINVRIGGNATGNAIGDNANVTAGIIAGGDVKQDDQLSKLFDSLMTAAIVRPADPKVDKEELAEAVQLLREEVVKSQALDESAIKRRLRSISRMAPDILEVIIETFKSPIAGVAAVIRKIALKVKEEAQQ